MRWFHQLVALFRSLFRSAQIDADFAEEMRFHVDRETQANLARGMSAEAAHRAARLRFGSMDAVHEWSRDDRPGAGFRQLGRDLRFGMRLLVKSPVFMLASVAIVALGIGAATAIFSVVYGVMLRPLPYREPDRLVTIWLERSTARVFPSAADVAELRQLRGVLDDVAMVRSSTELNLIGGGEPRRLRGARVSPNLFSVLRVSPMMGRTFARDEDQPGRNQVVVLSEALWRSRFGGDSTIVGRKINLSGDQHIVIGVMPSEAQYPSANTEAWVPAVLEPGELTRESINNYRVVARLRVQVTIDQARREASALARRLGNAYRWNAGAGFAVDSMLEDAVRPVRPALIMLLGAVMFLLLIACVNLCNLFGARATTRSGELAVRLALGASRLRLIAQSVAEAAPVLVIGGILGIVAAQGAVAAFVAAAPATMPRVESIELNVRVVAFSLVLLMLTGIAASVVPAVKAWRSDFTSITKDGGRGATSGRRRTAARRIGVAMQIAFALPLLVGASLLIRSAINVARVELGFRPEHVATFAFGVSRTTYQTDNAVADYYSRLVEAVRNVPGVATAAIGNRIPLTGAQTNPVRFETAIARTDEETNVDTRTVTPDYFATLGIPLVAGRTFTDRDDRTAPPVGIVDDRVAQTVWPGQSALGKRFRGPDGAWRTIIGVVGHVRTVGLEEDPRPQVYWSHRQWTQYRGTLAVRAQLAPQALNTSMIKAIRSVDPNQPVYDIQTMEDVVDRSLAQRRVTTALMVGFGVAALLLAAVGIYGVVAYGVTQRLREFGIRVALGSTPGGLTRLVVWQGASMAMIGAMIGVALAIAAAGAMSNLVFGVAPRDVVSIAGATALLVLVAGFASYLPARRAAGVDPGSTLRAE